VHTFVYKNSELVVNPLLSFQPVELTKKRIDVASPRRPVDESSCCILNRLEQPKLVELNVYSVSTPVTGEL